MVAYLFVHAEIFPHFTELYSDDVKEPEMNFSTNTSTAVTKVLRSQCVTSRHEKR